MSNNRTESNTGRSVDTLQVDQLLGDLEQRLGQLKNWQQQSQREAEQTREALAAIEHQHRWMTHRKSRLDGLHRGLRGWRKTIRQQKSEIEALRGTIQQKQEELEKRSSQIDADSRRIEEQRQHLSESTEQLQKLKQTLQERQQQIEKQRAELETFRSQHETQKTQFEATLQQFEERQAQADRQKQEISAGRKEIEEQRAKLAQETQQIEKQRQELADRQSRLKEQQDTLSKAEAEQQAQAQEIQKQRQQVMADWQKLDAERRRVAEDERKRVAAEFSEDFARQAERQQKLDTLATELEAQAAELEARMHQLDQQRSELESARRDMHNKQQQVEDERAKLTEERAAVQARKQRLDEMAGDLKQRALELERRTAEAKELAVQQGPIEEARKNIAQQQTLLDEARASLEQQRKGLEDRERQFQQKQADLEAQLQQVESARQEADDQAAAAEEAHQQQISQQRRELEEKAKQLEELEALLTQQQGDIETQRQALEYRQNRAETFEGLEGQVGEPSTELDAKWKEYHDTVNQAKAKLAAEQERLAQWQQDLETRTASGGKTADAAALERLRKLEAALREREAKLDEHERMLREQARSVEQVQNGSQADQQRYAGLLQQRQVLLEVKRFLENSEAEMVRRWATQKAASLVVTALLSVSVLAVASYMLGQRMYEPTWRATSVLQIGHGDEVPAAPDAWLNQEKAILLGDEVLAATVDALVKEGAGSFGNAAHLRKHLDAYLKVAYDGGNKIRLIYDQPGEGGRQALVPVLNCLARSFKGYQMVLDRQAGREDTVEILEPAIRQPQPIDDLRWHVTAAIFIGALALTFLSGLAIRNWMRKAEHLMDQNAPPEVATLTDDKAWPPADDQQQKAPAEGAAE
ncbi:MAG: hypothetical protein IT441_10135 [Phycisphaeraceae bacterium]|nr:hypothetical protein [Phycisphaeraceae bacterium]